MPDAPSPDAKKPRVFISYSWTTPAHQDRVRDLVAELRSAWDLDVRLDQWHLRTGEDPYHFMETEIIAADKVLIVSDCEYARKANARKGGAGTEAQILTPELYAQGGGDDAGGPLPKYAVAVTEYDDGGEACTPTFYGGRLFIDLTDPTRRAEKMEEIARWAHDQPLHVAPPIGGRPDFLERGPSTGTHGVRARAVSALAGARPDAARAVEDYVDRFADGLVAFAPSPPDDAPERLMHAHVQPAVLASANALGGAYIEAEGVFLELARARLGERGHDVFRRLFTALFPYVEEAATLPGGLRLQPWQRDVYHYLVPDLFRSAAASLVRVGDFDGFRALTAVAYTPSDRDTGGRRLAVRDFPSLQNGVRDGELRARVPQIRQKRGSTFTEDELGQTDLLLMFASIRDADDRYAPRWYPDALVGERVRYYGGVLPTFAQAESTTHLARLALASNRDVPAFLALIDALNDQDPSSRNRSGVPRLDYHRLTGRDRLGHRH